MKFFISIIALLYCLNSFAQSHSFYSNPDTITIDSKVFGGKRRFTISVPNDIEKLDQPKNCILYVDGDDDEIAGTIVQAANNLYLYDDIPQSVLVGVFHENRDEELMEKNMLYNFLVQEVIPAVSSKYTLRSEITMVGHSFGGYFATYCYLKNNAVFNNCIAVSPAYWPNEKDIFALAAEALLQEEKLTGNFYLAIGDKRWDDISLREDVFKFKSLLESGKGNIRFSFADLVGFNHNSSPTVGFGLGLNFIFDEWEWASVVDEQNNRISSFPDFWRHYELKGDALMHLKQYAAARSSFETALQKMEADLQLTAVERKKNRKSVKAKIKSARKQG